MDSLLDSLNTEIPPTNADNDEIKNLESFVEDNTMEPPKLINSQNIDSDLFAQKVVLEKQKEMEKLMLKTKRFDSEFCALIKQAKETIESKYSALFALGQSKPEMVCLNRYMNIYNHTDPEEHFQYFETLYNKYRFRILSEPLDDDWLYAGQIVIQFGDGIKSTPEMEQKRKQIRIMLSTIYRIAIDLRDKAEKTLDGIGANFTSDIIGKDLIRGSIFMLHLYRIFYTLAPESDMHNLIKHINNLEEELGVKNKTSKINPFTSSQKSVKKEGDLEGTNQIAGGLKGIFSMATGIMEKLGVKPPNMEPPSEQDINNVLNNVFNNENTQNVVQNILSSLQGCENTEDMLQKVFLNITDPKTLSAVNESTMKAAEELQKSNSI